MFSSVSSIDADLHVRNLLLSAARTQRCAVKESLVENPVRGWSATGPRSQHPQKPRSSRCQQEALALRYFPNTIKLEFPPNPFHFFTVWPYGSRRFIS